MRRLLTIIAFIYGLGLLMLVGWRSQTQGDGMVAGSMLFFVSKDDITRFYNLQLNTLKLQALAEVTGVDPMSYPIFITHDGKWAIFVAQPGDGTSTIYRMQLSSGKIERLSQTPGRDDIPVLSPNNQWIYFRSCRFGGCYIYRMRLNGSSKEQLTFFQNDISRILFAPNTHWVVFIDAYTYIYRMRLDGSYPQLLSLAPFIEPSSIQTIDITPDEQWIYISANNLTSEMDLWRMRIDGTQLENLSLNSNLARFRYISQDKKWILFSSDSVDDTLRVYRMDLATRMIQSLTPNDSQVGVITVTSDEKWIILSASGPFFRDILRVASNGGVVENLSQSPANDWQAVLSPDEKWIYFTSNRTNNFELYRMRLDGSQQQQLTFFNAYRGVSSPIFIPLPPMPLHTERLLGLGVILLGGMMVLAWVGRKS